jgi:hypothetical protein
MPFALAGKEADPQRRVTVLGARGSASHNSHSTTATQALAFSSQVIVPKLLPDFDLAFVTRRPARHPQGKFLGRLEAA